MTSSSVTHKIKPKPGAGDFPKARTAARRKVLRCASGKISFDCKPLQLRSWTDKISKQSRMLDDRFRRIHETSSEMSYVPTSYICANVVLIGSHSRKNTRFADADIEPSCTGRCCIPLAIKSPYVSSFKRSGTSIECSPSKKQVKFSPRVTVFGEEEVRSYHKFIACCDALSISTWLEA